MNFVQRITNVVTWTEFKYTNFKSVFKTFNADRILSTFK